MNTPNDNSTIGTNDQKRIEGHEEEKRLEAHSDTRVIPENASPSSTVAAAASIAGTEEAAKAADATDKPKEATQSDNEIPTIDVETPIRPQRVWSNIVLGLLVLMGAFVASYLLYYNYHGDTKTYPATAYATSVGHQSSKRTAPIHAEIGALYPAGTMAAQPVKGHAYGNHDKYSKDGARAITPRDGKGVQGKPDKDAKKASMHAAPMIVYVFPIETSTVSEAKSLNDLAKEAIDTDETIHINGYTDMSGSKAYNQKLSLERAKAVAEYLEKHGVPANHIVCQGMGPSCKYATPRQNRCVEAYIE